MGKKRKAQSLEQSIVIQTRLNPQNPREKKALEVFRQLLALRDIYGNPVYTVRDLVAIAIIRMTEDYQPEPDPLVELTVKLDQRLDRIESSIKSLPAVAAAPAKREKKAEKLELTGSATYYKNLGKGGFED